MARAWKCWIRNGGHGWPKRQDVDRICAAEYVYTEANRKKLLIYLEQQAVSIRKPCML
jgi:hypothetical protein